MYGGSTPPTAYNTPGALLIAGRDQYNATGFKNAATAGAHVLIYLDAIIDNNYGRYHQLLMTDSECGPATGRWLNSSGQPIKVNQWGNLGDFRPGSVMHQGKLECVMEKMVAENPHMAGFFMDDVGSRSWFPDLNWGTFGSANQQAYRDGAIEVIKTARRVADRHGLMVMVNGTWSAGTLANNGGGYPTMSQHGMSLADGGFVEHHDGEIAYWRGYSESPQWASQSPLTQGKAFNYAVMNTDAGVTEFRNSGAFAYVGKQVDYGTYPPPWGPFHATGLPTGVTRWHSVRIPRPFWITRSTGAPPPTATTGPGSTKTKRSPRTP